MNNSKLKTEQIEITLGQRLIQAREIIGFSRERVAELLCLKVCIVREIEEDSNYHSVNPTFFRGYIRSYAKLVKIPENEIINLLDKCTSVKSISSSPMRSFSLEKTQKKMEGWLTRFTWIIIIICISMVIVWWWQNCNLQIPEITPIKDLDPKMIDNVKLSLALAYKLNLNYSIFISNHILSLPLLF